MKIYEGLMIALKNMSQRKLRSWLTLIGIFAGIAAVVALISLGQGLQSAINDQFLNMGVNRITIQGKGSSFGPPGTNAVGKLGAHDISILEKIKGVDMALGRYIKASTIQFGRNEELTYVLSVPDSEEGAKKLWEFSNYDIDEGRLLSTKDKYKAFLGYDAKDVDGRIVEVGQKIRIENQDFTVVGTAKKKGNPIFDGSVLISQNVMEDIFETSDNDFNMIVVFIDNNYDLETVKDIAERTMRRDRGQKEGEEDFALSTPQEALESLNSILLTVQILLVGIAAISLVVGGIGIANTMYTAVLERTKEIGIMKSIGAKNKHIMIIFLFESGLLGLAGGVLGLLLGVLIGKSVEAGAFYYFGESIIKTSFHPFLIIGSLLFAFLLGAMAGTLPARQASKLKPVDALRA